MKILKNTNVLFLFSLSLAFLSGSAVADSLSNLAEVGTRLGGDETAIVVKDSALISTYNAGQFQVGAEAIAGASTGIGGGIIGRYFPPLVVPLDINASVDGGYNSVTKEASLVAQAGLGMVIGNMWYNINGDSTC